MMSQAYLNITGKVQGVFYRDTSQKRAQELNLTGYVKNMPDGSVEALVQGPKEDIEAFIKWCQQGPPSANVENVEVKWQEVTETYDSFEVTY